MAKTHQTVFRSGTGWTPLTDNDVDDTRLLGSKACYHALAIRPSRRRPLRTLRSRVAQRLACAVLVLAGLQFWLLHSAYYEALAEKFSPTIFTRLSRQDKDLLASSRWHLGIGDEHVEREGLLQNRRYWKSLGSGYEGDTFAYNGSVIKVFKPGRSPLRNCVPGTSPNVRWPPEIPVSLLLGGLEDQQGYLPPIPAHSNFVPVRDYFSLPSIRGKHPAEWYLVSPFLKSGTLEHLAKRLRRQDHPKPLTPEQVDARFRPSFNQLLRALEIMHTDHNLCHDDMKMDNIFVTTQKSSPPAQTTLNTSSVLPVGEEAHWLIADLGNVRQPSHNYHSSLLWTTDNSQHPDCRVNDVVRLVKSYLFFLQSATLHQKRSFVEPFLSAAEPWSQLYWYTINSARRTLDGTTAAQQVLEVSSNAFRPSSSPSAATGGERRSKPVAEGVYNNMRDDGIFDFARPVLEEASWRGKLWYGLGDLARKDYLVRKELQTGMSVSEKWAKIFGTMGMLPTPHNRC